MKKCSKSKGAIACKAHDFRWLEQQQRAANQINMALRLVRALAIFCAGALLPLLLR